MEWHWNEQDWPLNGRIGCCLYIETTPDSFSPTWFGPFTSHLASSVSLLSIPFMNHHWMMLKWIGMTSDWTNRVLSLYRDSTWFVHSDHILAHSLDILYFEHQSEKPNLIGWQKWHSDGWDDDMIAGISARTDGMMVEWNWFQNQGIWLASKNTPHFTLIQSVGHHSWVQKLLWM